MGVREGDFESHRSLLFSVAYRMLGSATEAEDLVQDAYIRFASTDRDVVRDVRAFLVTVLTRLALDRLKSGQVKRETYIGPWLPEPVATETDDPYAQALREERIEYAVLTVLQRLSPSERAVLLLADVLEHDHAEIAEILGITAASSRQLLHRARERVAAEKPRFTPSREEQERLVRSFLAAVRDGDVDALRSVLVESATAGADSGGKVPGAGVHPIVGADKVARLYVGLAAKTPDFEGRVVEVNNAPALLVYTGGTLAAVTTFTYADHGIAGIAAVVNPDKLALVSDQLISRI